MALCLFLPEMAMNCMDERREFIKGMGKVAHSDVGFLA